MTACPRLLIAGLGGDTGKTAVTAGLCRLLHEEGHRVTPFKKGPDYIDMEWLSRSAHRPCYNLDLFLMEKDQVIASFCMNTVNTDIALIEGNRGLYDGMGHEGSVSSAEIAKLLQAPVILVVDCTKVTRTVAALVLGCRTFDSEVDIKGVILNRLAGSRHESTIRKSIERYCDVPVVGAIPKLNNIQFPGRHLGLVPPQEHPSSEEALRNASEMVGKYLDIQHILEVARNAPHMDCAHLESYEMTGKKVNIGIIRDSAFQFYYPENVDALKRAGADIIEFSALNDTLPPSLHALYIGGGFPETHASALSGNRNLMNDIKRAAEGGLPIYAECGGLMYLSSGLVWEGKRYQMADIFPFEIGVKARPAGHGYTIAEVTGRNPFFALGTILRGHEFHYSYVHPTDASDQFTYAFTMVKGEGVLNKMDGICYRNVLATYIHVHAMGTPEWVQGIIHAAAHKEKTYL